MPDVSVKCIVCAQTHIVTIDDEQACGATPIKFSCPDVDRRFRLMGFQVDSRRSLLDKTPYGAEQTEALRDELGARDFDLKLERWKNIAYPPLGIIDEYPAKISQIVRTYAMGDAYVAVTSSCCLAERILNRLVLRCRDYFKAHPDYKRIYRKDSFDNWDVMLQLIEEWAVIPTRAIEVFQELKPIRNDTIHYSDGYDFEAVAERTVNAIVEAIATVFGVMNRQDLYLVFDVPGEVWVRSTAESLPFVKEFVLPFCYRAHAVHDVIFVEGKITKIIERLGRVGPLTDAEFVELRKSYRSTAAQSI